MSDGHSRSLLSHEEESPDPACPARHRRHGVRHRAAAVAETGVRPGLRLGGRRRRTAADAAGRSPQGGAEAAGTTTVTGDAVRTQYGPVQVRLTVRDGRVTEAAAIQAPSGGRSGQITADAVPRLNQAAVAAGSADIDAVSGATYTSTGYRQSLQSALDRVGGANAGTGAGRARGPRRAP
ncbi:hypothetical protein SGLAM104S_03103 [Streptomyces glaucescens]